MEEIWKDIPNYKGFYQVSTMGRIKRVSHDVVDSLGRRRHFNSSILKPRIVCGGYCQVFLYKNGKSKQLLVHRIVLSTFLGNSTLEVNHKDENKQNNRLSNLEWVTSKENCNYGTRNKRLSISKKGKDTAMCCERVGEKNPCSIKVYALNKDMTINTVYSCIREAGDAMGISDFAIGRWAKHKTKTNEYKGLLWYTEKNLPSNIKFK